MNTPLQTLLDERAKEFDEKFPRLAIVMESSDATGTIALAEGVSETVKARDRDSFLKGVRLGLAMGRDVLKEQKQWVFTTPYGLEIGDDEKVVPRKRTDDEYIKLNETIAALEAKEKELGV